VQISRHLREIPLWALCLAVLALGGIPCPAATATDKKDKDIKKNEKVEPWVEVRTPHFIVRATEAKKRRAA